MKTSFTFRTILILALVAPAGALAAQPGAQAADAAAAIKGRQIILEKLERMRLNSVAFDGLPATEVIKILRDESIKRDPEKKGINFIVNPNTVASPGGGIDPTTGLPVAAPSESVDISQVSVKIQPPLTDVRLVDVLDAVVEVADRPIKYTIEDYGVVFALREPGPARKPEVGFAFPGGTPTEFLDAVQKHFKVDWLSVAEIPRDMAEVRIPKLRLAAGALTTVPGRTGDEGGPLAALVSLYNQLGEQKPALGRLIVKGELARPSVVIFAPDKAAGDNKPKIKVKAFSVSLLTDEQRKSLEADIDRARREAEEYSDRRYGASRNLEGTFALHSDTKLLVATGTEAFVDMVESIVHARSADPRLVEIGPATPAAPAATPGK